MIDLRWKKIHVNTVWLSDIHLGYKGHQAVLRKLLAVAAGETRVIYIPGNHDELRGIWWGRIC